MNSKSMLIISCFVIIATFSVGKTVAEDKIVPKIYEEIGCTEIKDTNDPTRFDCPEVGTYADDKCYLGGKTFNVGDDVEGDVVPACRAACKCVKYEKEAAHIICANVECPENFHRNWDCISTYDNLQQCCRTGEICDQARILEIGKCEFGGKSYRVGEHFNPEDSCHTCICTEDFNSTLPVTKNPNCASINCGIGLHLKDLKDGCVPVYFKTAKCCPIEYKCPKNDDAIETGATRDDKHTCKFGQLNIVRGDKLKTDDKCLTCECSTPPYLTCIKTNDC